MSLICVLPTYVVLVELNTKKMFLESRGIFIAEISRL